MFALVPASRVQLSLGRQPCPFQPRRPAEVNGFLAPPRGGPSSLTRLWGRLTWALTWEPSTPNAIHQAPPQPGVNCLLRASAHEDPQGPWKKLVSRGGRGASRHLQGRRKLISRSSILPGEAGRGGPWTVGPTPSSFKEAEERSLCSVQGLTARGESTPDLPAPRRYCC